MVPNAHAPIAGQKIMTCSWADDSHTLCTNPACLERAAKRLSRAGLHKGRGASKPVMPELRLLPNRNLNEHRGLLHFIDRDFSINVVRRKDA